MKNSKALLGYLALAAMGSEMYGKSFNAADYNYTDKPLTDEERKERAELMRSVSRAQKDRLKQKQGLTEYFYNEGSLWALNDKTAAKKALKRGWTIKEPIKTK